MDKEKIDLSAPAFGEGSQKTEDVSADNPQPEPTEPEAKVTEDVAIEAKPSDDEEEEPKRVTYSRFKNVWSAKEKAEQEAEEARREAEELRQRLDSYRTEPRTESVDMPSWWIKLYGDSDESKNAWLIQRQANDELKEQLLREAREEALEAVKSEKTQEEVRVQENLGRIDSELEQLEAYVGRELTEKEESAILDIVDEYTAKDENGNYLGALMPFDKAWEVYELKNQAVKGPKSKARDAVAALSSSASQGEPSSEAERDKNFNPLDWSAWKKRL